MHARLVRLLSCLAVVCLLTACAEAADPPASTESSAEYRARSGGQAPTGSRAEHQYRFGDIAIPKASADEPILPEPSRELAHRYLEEAATAWTGRNRCVSCHTNGTYMVTRPALTASLGRPPAAMHDFFLTVLEELRQDPPQRRARGLWPAQAVYVAAGLAEWDHHVSGRLSAETERALELVFEVQNDRGTWGSPTCWPPYESDEYHKATVAAMAAATAPGWLRKVSASDNEPIVRAIGRLQTYLRTETPPHDYGRTLLLWAAIRMDGLLPDGQKEELVTRLLRHQRSDGGWSIRTLAAPGEWGDGNRAAKLESEPDFVDPPSDGHMTGLAVVVLRESGIAASDQRLRRAVAWLQSNQRASGRWWTRSLNTDSWHFITYSGTAFPLLALQMCAAMPAK